MTPEQFIAAGLRLYGRKKWMTSLAGDLGVDASTVYRISKRLTPVAGPTAVAVRALLENRRRRDALEKEARKLLPKKRRKRVLKPGQRKLIPYAGAP